MLDLVLKINMQVQEALWTSGPLSSGDTRGREMFEAHGTTDIGGGDGMGALSNTVVKALSKCRKF